MRHRRVAGQRRGVDVLGPDAAGGGKIRYQPVDRAERFGSEFFQPLRFPRVVDAADDVQPAFDLRVVGGLRRQRPAGAHVNELHGDRRGADVHGDAAVPVGCAARADAGDVRRAFAEAVGDGHAALILPQRPGQFPQEGEGQRHPGHVQRRFHGALEPVAVRQAVADGRRGHVQTQRARERLDIAACREQRGIDQRPVAVPGELTLLPFQLRRQAHNGGRVRDLRPANKHVAFPGHAAGHHAGVLKFDLARFDARQALAADAAAAAGRLHGEAGGAGRLPEQRAGSGGDGDVIGLEGNGGHGITLCCLFSVFPGDWAMMIYHSGDGVVWQSAGVLGVGDFCCWGRSCGNCWRSRGGWVELVGEEVRPGVGGLGCSRWGGGDWR